MSHVVVARPPANSLLANFLTGCDFHDAYEVALADPTETPSRFFARALRAAPVWVDRVMSVRNWLAGVFGLKTAGTKAARGLEVAARPRMGDAFGIYTVLSASADELLLGVDDRHADVRISVMRRVDANGARAVLTTAVRNHNWLGRLYMIPFTRIHPLVVKGILKAL